MSETRVVLITGGASGIGAATAKEYAKLAYRVAITARSQRRLDELLGELLAASPEASGHLLALRADLEDPGQVEGVVERTVGRFGRLDVLVNVAGWLGGRRALGHADFLADFQRALQVNLLAVARLAQLAGPRLAESAGVLVNVSWAAEPAPAHSVSVAGVRMLTKCLANSFEGAGVRVVGLAAGAVRPGGEAELAAAVLFLAGEAAGFIHGCTLDVAAGCRAPSGPN